MFNSFIISQNSSSILNKLFTTPSTSIDDVLSREDVTEYLRQFPEGAPPKFVLGFLERHVPKLLIAAQRLSSTQDDIHGDGASTSARPAAEGDGAEHGTGSSDCESIRGDALRRKNATELLVVYINSPDFRTAIDRIVPASLAALSREEARHTPTALSTQRILLSAFENDFVKTTSVIAGTLNEEMVRGIVRNLSESSIVAEMVIGLFGSALSAVDMMAASTHTQAFTAAWIQMHFPQQIVAYLPVAITTPAAYNYFYFLQEVLKRGFSHSAGPVVDVLLRPELIGPMFEIIVENCEKVMDEPMSSVVLLCGEGMSVVALTVGLIRKSLVPPETVDMYFTSANYSAPVKVVDQLAPRLLRLLDVHAPLPSSPSTEAAHAAAADGGGAKEASNTVGAIRSWVCVALTELSLLQLASTDDTLRRVGFLPAILRLCRRFPDNDRLARLMHTCFLQLFSRPLMLGETVWDAVVRDRLLSTVLSSVGDEGMGMIDELTHFALDSEFECRSLSAFSVDLLHRLTALPIVSAATASPLARLFARFNESEVARARVIRMQEEISGAAFSAKGSAQTGAVRHHKRIDLADSKRSAVRYGTISLSDMARTSRVNEEVDKEEESGSSAWRDSEGLARTAGAHGDAAAATADRATSEECGAEKPTQLSQSPVSMDMILREGNEVRANGSPQLRAFPSFSGLSLKFNDEAAQAAAPSSLESEEEQDK